MRDYRDNPAHFSTIYSLYLIQDPSNLNSELLSNIHPKLYSEGLTFSLERLYKGVREALVIYGPKDVLEEYRDVLKLLEIEDYSQKIYQQSEITEVGLRDQDQLNLVNFDLAKETKPLLGESDQVWWQLVLKAVNHNLWQGTLRALVTSAASNKVEPIKISLKEGIRLSNLLFLPQSFGTSKLINHYQKRLGGGRLNLDNSQIKEILS